MQERMSRTMIAAAGLLAVAGMAMGQVSYERGFTWQRSLDYDEGVARGSTENNPNTDALGNPVWDYGWVDQRDATPSTPWFALEPTRMEWSDAWFGRPELARWQSGFNQGPVIDDDLLLAVNISGSATYVPIVRWINPTGAAITVDLVGPARVAWSFAPTDGRIEVVIGRHDQSTGVVEVDFQRVFDKPTAGSTVEGIDFDIDLRDLQLGPADELVLAARKADALGASENVLFRDGELELTLVGPGCPADCDISGELNLLDFLCFQNFFDAGDLAADIDGDGELTLFDFLAFQNVFAAGCP